MSRHFRQPQMLEITADANGRPTWLRWRGRRERVSVCNTWRVESAWWQQPGPEASCADQNAGTGHAYYTLLTASRIALVVFQDEANGRWLLEQILD